MTKSFDKVDVQSLTHGLDYSGASGTIVTRENSETPVLDLSFRKSSSPPSTSNYYKVPSVSPLRESAYLEHQQETNNNDNKHISSYQHSESAQMRLAHHYHPEDQLTTFPSNHERKSPYESHSYVMTPPSECGSPKKPRFQSIYENTNIISESRRQPVYPTPILPVAPMPLPISVPAVLPTIVPQSSPLPASVPVQLPASVPVSLPASVPVSLPVAVPTSPPVAVPTSVSASVPSVPAVVPRVPSPTSSEVSQATTAGEEAKKAPRPFKAYPKDPLSISLGPDLMFDQELKKAYTEFRNRMLDSVKRTNEGTNIKMRRVTKSPSFPTSTCDDKDAAYWERRRKNNEAAKRSRDARRAKEDEIAIRAAFLEQEYIRLKYENALLKEENKKFKCMLYGH